MAVISGDNNPSRCEALTGRVFMNEPVSDQQILCGALKFMPAPTVQHRWSSSGVPPRVLVARSFAITAKKKDSRGLVTCPPAARGPLEWKTQRYTQALQRQVLAAGPKTLRGLPHRKGDSVDDEGDAV